MGDDHDQPPAACPTCGLDKVAHHPSHPSNAYVLSVHRAAEASVPDCVLCADPLAPHDRARHAHDECKLRSVVGGIGHLLDHQYWCIERRQPDADRTYRESALLVDQWVRLHGIEAAMETPTCHMLRPRPRPVR